jgi:hypothetical protein
MFLHSASLAVTASFSNPQSGASYIIKVVQNEVTPIDINWPAGVKWEDAATPVVTNSASAEDIYTFWYDGSSYYGSKGSRFQ